MGKYREGLTRVESLRNEVRNLESENESLKKEKDYRQTPDFLEKGARNKLRMVKEGEHLVVLPEVLPVLGAEASVSSESALPIWEQWWRVFFGKL